MECLGTEAQKVIVMKGKCVKKMDYAEQQVKIFNLLRTPFLYLGNTCLSYLDNNVFTYLHFIGYCWEEIDCWETGQIVGVIVVPVIVIILVVILVIVVMIKRRGQRENTDNNIGF